MSYSDHNLGEIASYFEEKRVSPFPLLASTCGAPLLE
jgi:hypothetical protein